VLKYKENICCKTDKSYYQDISATVYHQGWWRGVLWHISPLAGESLYVNSVEKWKCYSWT